MYRTLDGFNIRQNWPAAWGTKDAKLVIALDNDLVSDDGVHFEGADHMGASLASLGFHWSSDITVTDGLATAGAISGLPTTDSTLPPYQARFHVYIYVRGSLKAYLSDQGFWLYSSASTVFTWAEWVAANQAQHRHPNLVPVVDYSVVQRMIEAVLGIGNYASDLLAGNVFLDVPALSASHPEVVGTNSPRLGRVKMSGAYSGATEAQKMNAAIAALGGLPGEVWHFDGGNLGGGTSADPNVNTNIVVVKSNCTLRLFPGTFTHQNERPPFQLEDNASIIGSDNRTVIIEESTAGATANHLEFCCIAAKGHVGPAVPGVSGNGSTSRNINIKNIQIKGVRSDSHAAGKAIDVGNLHGGEISGIFLNRTNAQGIHVGGFSGATNGGDPLGLGRYADGVTVKGCSFDGVAGQAVALVNCQNCTVDGTAHAVPGKGSSGMGGGGIAPIDLEPNGATDRMANILITGNNIDMENSLVSGTPILIQNTAGLTNFGPILAVGNVLKGGSIDGGLDIATSLVRVTGSNARDVLIASNHMRSATSSAVYTAGLRTQIIGNYMEDVGSAFAVEIASTARYTNVQGNSIHSGAGSSSKIVETVNPNDGSFADFSTVHDNLLISSSANNAKVDLLGANSRAWNNYRRQGGVSELVDQTTRTAELGTLTSNAPARSTTVTYNNAAVTFVNELTNIVNTASGANSLFFDYQIAGVSKIAGRLDGSFVAGGLELASAVPAQFTSNQNDFNPGDYVLFLYLTTDASRNLTGLLFNTGHRNGRMVIIVNPGTQPLVLVNESALSGSANRFHNAPASDITLNAGQMVLLRYDTGVPNRWRVAKMG